MNSPQAFHWSTHEERLLVEVGVPGVHGCIGATRQGQGPMEVEVVSVLLVEVEVPGGKGYIELLVEVEVPGGQDCIGATIRTRREIHWSSVCMIFGQVLTFLSYFVGCLDT